jgi:hypothetical protein
MPGKMARSAPRPPFGLTDALVAVLTSRLSCRKAGNTRTFTPDRESSGESRSINAHPHCAFYLDPMIAGPEGGPSSDMQRYEG